MAAPTSGPVADRGLCATLCGTSRYAPGSGRCCGGPKCAVVPQQRPASGLTKHTVPRITPNTLPNNALDWGVAAEPSKGLPPKFAASSLNMSSTSLVASPCPHVDVERMTQQSEPDPVTTQSDAANSDASPAAPEVLPPAEPSVERSRFSQWLASFGLGELQHPLLTRTRPPAPRRRS